MERSSGCPPSGDQVSEWVVEHRTGKSPGHGLKPPWSPKFFSGFFTQLHKLGSLRRSFLHFHFISAVHIWFISYIINKHFISVVHYVLSALVTNLKYWRLTGMFYLLIMVCCGCAVSTLLRSHASSLLIPTWSGLLRISPLAWTSTHRYLPHSVKFGVKPFQPQYPHKNSSDWSSYIFLKTLLGEFDKRSKNLPFWD